MVVMVHEAVIILKVTTGHSIQCGQFFFFFIKKGSYSM